MENLYSTTPIIYQEFRLIELAPSAESDIIECSLRSYSFNGSHPEYIALSYAWGRNVRDKFINLNGTQFPVGSKLWWFLHHMRLRNQYHTFWIDAICIDQSNVVERNHQVQKMRQIYSNAKSASVGLGKDDTSSGNDIAMRYMARRTSYEAGNLNFGKLWSARQVKAILALCEMNYWRRVWIIQEIMLAKEVTIYCGSKSITWNKFEQLVKDLQAISDRGREHHTPCASSILASPAIVIAKAKAAWDGDLQPLTTLLRLYRNHEATNMLDKVYALHGLAKDSADIAVDYDITAHSLLRKKTLLRFGEMMKEMLEVHYSADKIDFHISMAEQQFPDDQNYTEASHIKSDNIAVSNTPSGQSSWRYMTSKRIQFTNSARLENASWRAWIKLKNHLRTITPKELKWLKDYDVTWLYGPLIHYSCRNANILGIEFSNMALSKTSSYSNLHKKPILERMSMSEFMLQRPVVRPPPPLLNQAIAAATSSSAASTSLSNITPHGHELKHIRFNELVEQRIAADVIDEDDEDTNLNLP
ncbi:HET domain-containing protein [Trichoderma evansii]